VLVAGGLVMTADQLASLRPVLRGWLDGFEPCFKRAMTLLHFQGYVLGLMADL